MNLNQLGLSSAEKKEFIEFLVDAGALLFGDFTTKSGRKTPYFVNTGRFDDGQKIATLGAWYARAIRAAIKAQNIKVDTIFGPAYKGIPLAVATSAALSTTLSAGHPTGYTFNRKEAKTHGDGGLLVGFPLKKDTRVVLVEDVITAGTTMREVLPMLHEIGVSVVGVFVAVDRMERGTDVSASISAVEQVRREFNVAIHPLITLLDIIEYVRGSQSLQHLLPAIENYRSEYGV